MLSSPIHLAHHRSAVAPLSLRCYTATAPLSHRYRYAVALLSLRCRTAITPLSFRYRSAAIAPLSRCCRTSITLVSLHFLSSAIAPVVATQSHRYHTAIAPLSRCGQTAVAPAQRGYKQFKIELLFLYCHSTVASAVNQKIHMVVASRCIIRVTVTM